MRVLWFSISPSLYKNGSKYNGIGWIASLQKLMMMQPDIDLGIAFVTNDNQRKIVQDNVTYYPIDIYDNKLKKLEHFFFYERCSKNDIRYFLDVIDDFKPDVIHIFGSESSFGLIIPHVKIPVVLHIQGILNPYVGAWFPPGTNVLSYIKGFRYKIWNALYEYQIFRINKSMASQEATILSSCHNFIGRTHWDKNLSSLYSPESKYFYVSEVLRDSFYQSPKWEKKQRTKKKLITTISPPMYKGADVILKTAELLKKHYNDDFEWYIYGAGDYSIKFIENIIKINHKDVNVFIGGVVKEQDLVEKLLDSDIYIHPSYIDNSPNSVCEAQLLGVPIIATNVGGVASLVEDKYNGMLVPSNDPYLLASYIKNLLSDDNLSKELSLNGIITAEKRHSKETIIKDLINTYQNLEKPL